MGITVLHVFRSQGQGVIDSHNVAPQAGGLEASMGIQVMLLGDWRLPTSDSNMTTSGFACESEIPLAVAQKFELCGYQRFEG